MADFMIVIKRLMILVSVIIWIALKLSVDTHAEHEILAHFSALDTEVTCASLAMLKGATRGKFHEMIRQNLQ